MAASMLKIDIRRGKILEKLRREDTVSVSQLAQELGATPVTIRSDLDALEAEGHLLRVQGGAVRKLHGSESVLNGQETAVSNLSQKKTVARAVVEHIRDGDTLFLNSGTTVQQIVQALRRHRNINVVTNSLAVAAELGSVPSFRVILLGGEINAQYGFSHGSDAQEQLGRYQADWAVLSLDGISTQSGLTTYHAEEAAINRLMIARAKGVIVAADHTKVGRAGFFRFSEADEKILLVTDSQAPDQAVQALEEQGITVQKTG